MLSVTVYKQLNTVVVVAAVVQLHSVWIMTAGAGRPGCIHSGRHTGHRHNFSVVNIGVDKISREDRFHTRRGLAYNSDQISREHISKFPVSPCVPGVLSVCSTNVMRVSPISPPSSVLATTCLALIMVTIM